MSEVKVTEQDPKHIKVSRSDESATALQEHAPTEPKPVSEHVTGGQGGAEEAPSPRDPLEEALEEARTNRDRWMRAVADLENYKKRTLQEKSRFLKYRNEELLRDLLGVLDNLERAFHHCQETGRSDALADGVCMIADMLRDILGRYGVKEIKSLGEPFDPHLHEAIARFPVEGKQANVVVEELEKGYMYQDRLLRPAKVAVSTEQDQ